MSLSRLRRDRDGRQRVRGALAEIYGAFTEDFDTGDLQEVGVLLGEPT